MRGARVLVVDDELEIRLLVRELLERAGIVVHEAAGGSEALELVPQVRPDLVVLDVSMRGMDGWQALERIREMSDAPVLMLTGHSGELDKVRGLQGGADDYVTKPFGRQELLARVHALLRRAQLSGVQAAAQATYDDGLVRIDVPHARVEVAGSEVALTPLEFRLLVAFVRHTGEVLSREQLLDLVWGDTAGVGRDQVKLYVGYLRRKLETALGMGRPSPIQTVRGFGYRYEPD